MKPSGLGLLFVGSFLITASISLGIIYLFRFSDSSWFIFGRLYVSRKFSISSRLSSLLAYNCLWHFLQPFVFLWCQLLFLLFHFWFYLFGSFLFFSWKVWYDRFVNLIYLLKEPDLGFIDFLYHFLRLYFVYFRSDL